MQRQRPEPEKAPRPLPARRPAPAVPGVPAAAGAEPRPGRDPRQPPAPARPGGWRGWLAMALCAAALGLLALAPAAALRLADTMRLGRVQAVADPYDSQPLDGEDFYLVRMLAQRYQAAVAGTALVQLGAAGHPDTMTQSGDMGRYALRLLEQLADAGVLPMDCLYQIAAIAGLADVPYDGMYSGGALDYADPSLEVMDYYLFVEAGYYYSLDTLGFITVCFFPPFIREGQYAGMYDQPLYSLVVESHTGQVVQLACRLADPPADCDAQALLHNWLAMTGLDALEDWQPPQGTQYEANGLYSTRGGLLATCTVVQDDRAGVEFRLSLTAQAPPARFARSADGEVFVPAAVGPLRVLEPAGNELGGGFSDGDGYYFAEQQPGGGALLRQVTVEGEGLHSSVLCARAGCAHTDSSCPAWLPYSAWVYPFTAGGQLYLLHQSDPHGLYDRTALQSAADAQAPLFEHAVLDTLAREMAASWQDTAWLERLTPEGTRERVAALPDGVAFAWCDDAALYGRRTAAGSVDPEHCYESFVRLDLATGQLWEKTLPADSPLCRDCTVVPCGRQLVLYLREPAEPAALYLDLAHTPLLQTDRYLRWDPATGSCTPLAEFTQTLPVRPLATVGETLYLYDSESGDLLLLAMTDGGEIAAPDLSARELARLAVLTDLDGADLLPNCLRLTPAEDGDDLRALYLMLVFAELNAEDYPGQWGQTIPLDAATLMEGSLCGGLVRAVLPLASNVPAGATLELGDPKLLQTLLAQYGEDILTFIELRDMVFARLSPAAG